VNINNTNTFPAAKSPPIHRYQIIMLGDRGTTVWTTCPASLVSHALTGSRNHDLLITSLMPNLPCHHDTQRPQRWQYINLTNALQLPIDSNLLTVWLHLIDCTNLKKSNQQEYLGLINF